MKIKQLLISSLGNVLEWFDFALFIYLAPILGEKFFPISDPKTATLAALSIFAMGFICRPLGGIFFGHLGDCHGRSKTLSLSILMISIATLIVGIMPSYASLGIVSSILFLFIRIAQGFAIGGEYSGIMIYIAECAPKKKRGFFTSFAATGANVGFLLSTLCILILKTLFSESTLHDWGWRLPFIMMGIIGIILFYHRNSLEETPAYLNLKSNQQIQKYPLLLTLRHAPFKLLQIFCLTCMNAVYYYFFIGYLPHYLSMDLKVSSYFVFSIQSVSLLLMLLLVPISGLCGDLFGRKNMLIFTATGMILLTLPCFFLLNLKSSIAIMIALAIATLFSSLEQGNTLTSVVENCPVNIRYSGIGLAYNLGNGIIGGTAPLIFCWLSQYVSPMAPAYYLMGMIGISLMAILTLEPTHVSLRRHLKLAES